MARMMTRIGTWRERPAMGTRALVRIERLSRRAAVGRPLELPQTRAHPCEDGIRSRPRNHIVDVFPG